MGLPTGNGTAAAVWQTIALLLISVTMALAGYFGQQQEKRIVKLEEARMVDKIELLDYKSTVIEKLTKMDTKLDQIIEQHRREEAQGRKAR